MSANETEYRSLLKRNQNLASIKNMIERGLKENDNETFGKSNPHEAVIFTSRCKASLNDNEKNSHSIINVHQAKVLNKRIHQEA